MPQFNTLEEYEKWRTAFVGFETRTQYLPVSRQYVRKLWHGAKNNFYYRDDHPKAAVLCKQLIERFSLTEEADEAKLLLYDIRIDIKNLVGEAEQSAAPQSMHMAATQEMSAGQELEGLSTATKLSIATAVVALPVIGIAQDGVIGIMVPEIAALAVMGSVLWGIAKIRTVYINIKNCHKPAL